MKKLFLVFLALTFLTGCSLFHGINLNTKEKEYVAVRAELNILLQQYIEVQRQVSPENHKKAKKAFMEADRALDIWQSFLNTSYYDPQDELMVWMDCKNIIMEVLRNGR